MISGEIILWSILVILLSTLVLLIGIRNVFSFTSKWIKFILLLVFKILISILKILYWPIKYLLNHLKTTLLIFLAGITIFFIYGNYLMLSEACKILLFNYGKIELFQALLLIIIASWIGFIGYQVVLIIQRLIAPEKKLNWTFWITVYLILSLFWIGTVFISSFVGIQPLDLRLRDANNNNSIVPGGQVDCTIRDKSYLLGEKIQCRIKPQLSNMSIVATFKSENKTWKEDISETFQFTASEGMDRIHFSINGKDKKRDTQNYTIAYDYKFLTMEEYNSKRAEFVKWMLSLFGILLFAVPSAVLNFEKITKRNERTDER